MCRQRIFSAALPVVFILSIVTMASRQGAASQLATASAAPAQGGKTSYEVPVTTVVFDNDSAGSQLLMRSDDYNGAGQATYTTSNRCGSKPCLESEINYLGAWHLNLYNQSVRTLWITPNDPIDASQPAGPPAGYYWQNVEAYCECYDQSGNKVPFQNLTNGSNNCSFGVDFHYPNNSNQGTIYKLLMNPHLPVPGPATGLASVTCNAVSNGQCVNWTIESNTLVANANVADLFYYGRKGMVFVGQYYNTFRINASNP